MLSPEILSFYNGEIARADGPLGAATAIQKTVAKFIPRYDRTIPGAEKAIELKKGSCFSRWKMAARLAERQEGFTVMGLFTYQSNYWSWNRGNVHAQLLLWAEEWGDFILVEPAPTSKGGFTRYLGRSTSQPESAHRDRLKEQVAQFGRPIGSLAWRYSTVDEKPSSVSLLAGVGDGSQPLLPGRTEEPSLALSYTESVRVIRDVALMRQLLLGNLALQPV